MFQIFKISFILLYSASLLSGQNLLGKDDLIDSILTAEVYSTYNKPAISLNLDMEFLNYHLEALKKDSTELILTDWRNSKSIVLKNDEIEYILNSFEAQLGLRWNASQFHNTELIEFDQINDYLGKDPNNTVVLISEPIYIRKSSLAIIFFSKLCCGGGGGFVELTVYKKVDNKWNRHLNISEGHF